GGLSGNTAYYINVRSACDTNNFSAIQTLIITTPPCPPPCPQITNITTNTTQNGVSISWPAEAHATSYEYLVDSNPANPSGSGISTSGNSVVVNGLNPGTQYYVHTRCQCGTGNFSDWSAA